MHFAAPELHALCSTTKMCINSSNPLGGHTQKIIFVGRHACIARTRSAVSSSSKADQSRTALVMPQQTVYFCRSSFFAPRSFDNACEKSGNGHVHLIDSHTGTPM